MNDKFEEKFYTPEFYEQCLEFVREYSKEIVPEIFDDSIKTNYPNFKIEKIGNLQTQEKKSKDYYKEKYDVFKRKYPREFAFKFLEAIDQDVKAIIKKEFDEYMNENYPSDLKERIKQHIINEKKAKLEARKEQFKKPFKSIFNLAKRIIKKYSISSFTL